MELADNEENGIRPSPSPRPSPLGRGRIVCPHLELARTLWLVQRRAARPPLPKGEGRGEGEQDVSHPMRKMRCFKTSKRDIPFRRILSLSEKVGLRETWRAASKGRI